MDFSHLKEVHLQPKDTLLLEIVGKIYFASYGTFKRLFLALLNREKQAGESCVTTLHLDMLSLETKQTHPVLRVCNFVTSANKAVPA